MVRHHSPSTANHKAQQITETIWRLQSVLVLDLWPSREQNMTLISSISNRRDIERERPTESFRPAFGSASGAYSYEYEY
eukprot:scaffold366211_cov38-Prasinocladus_malaysianus.AAC.1